jgi:hypothetical protein
MWTLFIRIHSALHIFLFYHNTDQRSTNLGKKTQDTCYTSIRYKPSRCRVRIIRSHLKFMLRKLCFGIWITHSSFTPVCTFLSMSLCSLRLSLAWLMWRYWGRWSATDFKIGLVGGLSWRLFLFWVAEFGKQQSANVLMSNQDVPVAGFQISSQHLITISPVYYVAAPFRWLRKSLLLTRSS